MNTFLDRSHPEAASETRENHKHGKTLCDVANEIESFRLARTPAPSQNGWVSELPGLGSQKTYSKILDGKLDGISIAAQLPKYRGVLAILKAAGKDNGEEELYEDQPGTQACLLQAVNLLNHNGPNRFIEIKGPNGSGKTSALKVIRANVGDSMIKIVQAKETWKSEREFFEDTLAALGVTETERAKLRTNGDRFRKLVEVMPRGKFLLAFDEFHHVTARIINHIKSLMNETGVRVIGAGIATLMAKLKASAAEEAKQLFQNRLYASIILSGPDAEWVKVFVARRMNVEIGPWKGSVLTDIVQHAVNHGSWSYTRRVVEHLRNGGITSPSSGDLENADKAALAEVAA